MQTRRMYSRPRHARRGRSSHRTKVITVLAGMITLLAVIGTCISLTFINPFSHQSNLMVMDPGGYTFGTFARFGLPLFITSVACAGVVGFVLLRV